MTEVSDEWYADKVKLDVILHSLITEIFFMNIEEL